MHEILARGISTAFLILLLAAGMFLSISRFLEHIG
jgi:hypothetical protein